MKSGYKHLISSSAPIIPNTSSSNSLPNELWEKIWSFFVPSKIKHFIWRLCHNMLPTRATLLRKKIAQTPSVSYL